MLKAACAVLALCLVAPGAEAQRGPAVTAELRSADPPEVLVSVRRLLDDRRFVRAMESGFPLYVEYRVQLRESRSLWDRTVAELGWEYVVLYDPVRALFVVEDVDGSTELPDRGALADRLRTVYVVRLSPDGEGAFHYRARVDARTLSDEDVNEVFAWLKGENGDSARLSRPGFVTRTARRLLLQIAPLPRVTLDQRTPDFRWP